MGQSTEELSGEIAQTRASLASDLDALQDKVSPAAIVQRRKAAARDRFGRARSRVMGTVRSVRDTTTDSASSTAESAQDRYDGAPLAAGVVAFGAGMVLASMWPAAERETIAVGKLVDAAKEHGRPMVEEAKSQAKHAARQVGESASDAVEQVKEAATQGADRVSSQGQSAVQSVRDEAAGG
jgi:ElaB/YqjD/DUF883 family membrane-anchored ribosome-binding protein